MTEKQLKSLQISVWNYAQKYCWHECRIDRLLMPLRSPSLCDLVGMHFNKVRSGVYQAAAKINRMRISHAAKVDLYEDCLIGVLAQCVREYPAFHGVLHDLEKFGLSSQDSVWVLLNICIDDKLDFTQSNPLRCVMPAFVQWGLPNTPAEAIAALKGAMVHRRYVNERLAGIIKS